MTYELNKKQFSTRALKKVRRRGPPKHALTDSDNLRLGEVGERHDVKLPTSVSLLDHLNLQAQAASGEEIPDNVMFPEELNTHLRNRLQELTSENGRLRRELDDTESRLKSLTAQNEQLSGDPPSPLFGLGRASELAASKIVELSKKVRELTAEHEGAKARWKTAEARLRAFEEATEPVAPQDAREPSEANEDEVKSLTDKLNASKIKLCEARNQNVLLKQELTKLNKALTNEVGDSVSLQSITSGAGWRGRAQQILTLQQKVSELQRRLGEGGAVAGGGVVRHAERDRHAALERALRETQDATLRCEEVRRKLDATRARCRVLESDLDKKKRTIDHYTVTDANDKELIRTMSAELERMEQQQAERERKEERKAVQWEEKYNVGQELLARERSRCERLQQLLRDKDDKLQQLRKTEMEGGGGGGARDRALSAAARAEHLRLTELVSVLDRRLEAERGAAGEAEGALRRERARCARLEARCGRLEVERGAGGRGDSYRGTRASPDRSAAAGLRDKVELLQEEVLALQARLGCVQREREEDLRVYKASFDEAQRAFLQGIGEDTPKTQDL